MGGDASEPLEAAEAALDGMACFVEVGIGRQPARARRAVRDHRFGPLGGDGVTDVVGVVGEAAITTAAG